MASPSRFLPSSPFLTSSVLQFKALILDQTQTLRDLVLYFTLSNSHFSIQLALQLLKQILLIQTLTASNAIAHSSLYLQCLAATATVHSTLPPQHSYRRCLVLTSSLCTPNAKVFSVSHLFSFSFFVSLVDLICYGNQILKSNKPKDL